MLSCFHEYNVSTNFKFDSDLIAVTAYAKLKAPYSVSDPIIVPFNNIWMTELESVTADVTIPAQTSVGYILYVNNQPLFWDGVSWVRSELTLDNSNTLADIIANAGSAFSLRSQIKIGVILHSETGSASPELVSMLFEYADSGFADPTIETVHLHGQMMLQDGVKENIQIRVILTQYGIYNDDVLLLPKVVTTYTDANGRFDLDIVSNNKINDLQDTKYLFQFVYDDVILKQEYKFIPDVADVDYKDLPNPPDVLR